MKALFGGSFNPVHIGHLIVARDVLETFGLEEIIFVPANIQPLKGKLMIPAKVRLKILREAVKLEDRFSVWTYEIEREVKSYTVETLREFHRKYREKPAFIMGSDSFNSLPLWKEPKEILKLSTLIVVVRPGCPVDIGDVERKLGTKLKVFEARFGSKATVKPEFQVIIFRGRSIDISATEIRKRLKSGLPISYFLPESSENVLRRWWKNALQENV